MASTEDRVKEKVAVGEQQLWASRFKKSTASVSKKYTDSTVVDRHMFYHDVWGSQAHTIMLAYTGVITDGHAKKILTALQEVKRQFSEGEWDLQLSEEDVHMNVERFVINQVGIENGGRMHTTRSRNDQVVLDTKMYTRDQLRSVQHTLVELIDVLIQQSKLHTKTIMPGYTHTQHAQPITFAYWLTQYAAVFLRDLERLSQAEAVVDTNPLGAGALSGTSFPIDRNLTTRLLGFSEVQVHCLDAVSARDFNLQTLSSLSILFSSISRLADEIIYGITHEFGYMVLDDGFAMGSSMMPQKKNPGVLELIRGRTGKMYGILMAMLTTMKGLPSGYNRDYHEDKETLVESLNLMNDTLQVMVGVIETLTIKPERMAELVTQNFATATELANYLVREHNIPFRLCHRIVGYVVGELVVEGKSFLDKARTKELLAEKEIFISDDDYERTLNPEKVICSHTMLGGVSPEEVSRIISEMENSVAIQKSRLELQVQSLEKAKMETADIVSKVVSGESVKASVESVLG